MTEQGFISVNTGSSFSFNVKFYISILIIGLCLLSYFQSFYFLILVLFTLPIFLSKSIFEVNFTKRKIFRYHSLFGKVIGKGVGQKFNQITDLYITKNNYKKQLQSRSSSRTIKYSVYKGFAQVDNKKMIFIESTKVAPVLNILEPISNYLDIKIRRT